MNMNWKMTDEQKLQLGTGFAYGTARRNSMDKTGECTVYDVVEQGKDDASWKERYNGYGQGKNHDSGANNWTVNYDDVLDEDGPGESGFYGCVVKAKDENGEEHAVLVFRGSNGDMDLSNPDWGNNNIKSIFGYKYSTEQEQKAAEFAIRMMEKYPDLDFSMVGHSLGGHLSFYTAIYIAQNRPDLRNRINEVSSLDGYGFPQEFIAKYKDGINWLNEKGKLDHMGWSFVGKEGVNPSDRRREVEVEGSGFFDINGVDRHNGIIKIRNGEAVEGKNFWSNAFGQGGIDLLNLGGLALVSLIPGIGPFVAFAGLTNWVWNKIGGWEGIKRTVSDAWNSFTSSCSNFFGGIVNYFKKKNEKKLDGDYEVNLHGLGEVAENYLAISGKIKTLADDSEIRILSGWDEIFKMQDSFFLKTSARICIDGTRTCANALKTASDGLNEVLRLYKQGDFEASELYYTYKVASN